MFTDDTQGASHHRMEVHIPAQIQVAVHLVVVRWEVEPHIVVVAVVAEGIPDIPIVADTRLDAEVDNHQAVVGEHMVVVVDMIVGVVVVVGLDKVSVRPS